MYKEKIEENLSNLLKQTNPNLIVETLRNIINNLIRCKIVINDLIVIQPFWIEIYYFNKGIFECPYSHQNSKQASNKFGLYFHEKGRGGIDLVLPLDGNAYLSVLLKHSFIENNNKFLSQIKLRNEKIINNILIEKIKIIDDDLFENISSDVKNYYRIGVPEKTEKSCIPNNLSFHFEKQLAAFRVLKNMDENKCYKKYKDRNSFYHSYFKNRIKKYAK